jgi:hypothetical protein
VGRIDKDLGEIAHFMLNWEVRLSIPLGLTAVDVQAKHLDDPELQR